MKKYRRGIVGVFINEKGRVLLAERSDLPGAWQFPQGGIEKGESAREAFFREIQEELGNAECIILKVGRKRTVYEWSKPDKKYAGQRHTWFLARFKKGEKPYLEKSDGSFRRWKWEIPKKALAKTIDWKKDAVRAGLETLGLLKPEV